MMRWPIITLTLIFATSRAAAQDMPLSQILIDGEGWKEAPRDAPVFRPRSTVQVPGVEQRTCTTFSPNGGTLYVGSAIGKYVWAFRVENGSLNSGQPYCSLRVPRGQKDMPVTGLTRDDAGRVYAATPIGVQVFDPTGRLCGVLLNPTREPLRDVNLVGELLYVSTDSGVYVRKLKAREPAP